MSHPYEKLLTQSMRYGNQGAKAKELFDDALRAAHIKQLLAKVTRHSRRLLNLTEVERQTPITNRHYQGNQVVPLTAIRGSLNRVDNFDIDFHPLQVNQKARWVRVALAYLRDEVLPPVELIQVKDDYYVLDGHHRVSVARALDGAYIDAVVTVWKTAS
jgi:hypothetical protein